MLKIGHYQDLKIKRFSVVGAYLTPLENEDIEVLLPKKYLQEDFKEGLVLHVFIYRASKDQLVATLEKPKAILGELAYLEVVSVSQQGAFLAWGLDKDLFLPFREQTCEVKEGKKYLIAIYLNKSDRICATMNVSKCLQETSHYEVGQWLEGVVYSLHEKFGAYVAVENLYSGRIPLKELHVTLKLGDCVKVRVTKIHEDGKLELSLRENSYLQRDVDSEKILEVLELNNGYLPLHDNSDPAQIREAFQMSKKAFKKAVGKLFKEKAITIESEGIRKL